MCVSGTHVNIQECTGDYLRAFLEYFCDSFLIPGCVFSLHNICLSSYI